MISEMMATEKKWTNKAYVQRMQNAAFLIKKRLATLLSEKYCKPLKLAKLVTECTANCQKLTMIQMIFFINV